MLRRIRLVYHGATRGRIAPNDARHRNSIERPRDRRFVEPERRARAADERARPDDALHRATRRPHGVARGGFEPEVALHEHVTVPAVRRDRRHAAVDDVRRVGGLQRFAAIDEPPALGVREQEHARLEMPLEKWDQERFVARA